MNPTLRFAQKEINKLKRIEDKNKAEILTITVDFTREQNRMKDLLGYPAYKKALEALGGERTEENILEACRVSGLSRGSIQYDDLAYEPFIIKVPLPKGLF